MVLVDTSVWIQVFRRHQPLRLEQEVEFEDIVTCLPIIQEVLQGFRDETTYRLARDAMFALPIVESPLEAALVEDAIDLYRRARRAGFTVRSGVDCLIAAAALRNGLTVLHHDRDFDVLSNVSQLESRSLRRSRS